MKYTYLGDATLDGFITGDDYFAIDSGFAAHTSGYVNGDFDYSARIDADDYFDIDSHYNKGNVALSAALSAELAPVEQTSIEQTATEQAATEQAPTKETSIEQTSVAKIPTVTNPPTIFSTLNISSAYDRLSESDELL